MSKAEKKKQAQKQTRKKASSKSKIHQRTLADQRKAAVHLADKTMAEANEFDFPEFTKLCFYVCYSFESATELLKFCKEKTDIQTFVVLYTYLDEYLMRAKEMLGKSSVLLQNWPENPGITFSFVAGSSALELAVIFSHEIWNKVVFYKSVFFDLQYGKNCWKDTEVVVSPKPDPCLLHWRDLTINMLKIIYLPPEWPMWEINRDYNKFIFKLQAECAEVQNEIRKNREVLSVEEFIKRYCEFGHDDNIASIKKAFTRLRDSHSIPNFPEPYIKGKGSRPDKYTRGDLKRIWPYGKDKLPRLKE